MTSVTIPMSEQLKGELERHLESLGITWTQMLENIVGKEASPSVDKALKEAYESGDHPKTYSDVDEMFRDILGAGWDA